MTVTDGEPALAADGVDRRAAQPFATRSEVIAPHGMAATSQPLATQIALDMLKAGGTAVDAAIAANAALGLMEPTGSGVGGDLFALVWDAAAQRLVGLNGSGHAPRGLSLQMLREQCEGLVPARGPLPVTVPGAVAGWGSLHGRYGRLPLATLLAPAISYAREGFPVSEVIARQWAANAATLKDWPGFAAVFMPRGRAPAKGERFRNPALANTYERLADGGCKAFYEGDMARGVAAFITLHGGYLTAEDFAAHRSEWVEPVNTDYRGYTVWELPPNGQGIAVLQILNILEQYDLAALGCGSADVLHLLIEAKKLVFEDRARYYADPDFVAIPLDVLLSKEYAAERRRLIDPRRASERPVAGDARLEAGETVYLTTADQEGNMVSLIQSNYRGMGSGLTPDGLGFVLHNRGELFSLQTGHANVYAPGKRPFHTIIPGFVTRDGAPLLAFGVMGGAMQPQGQVQILLNLIDFGMNLQQAGDAPRLCHHGSSEPTGTPGAAGGVVALESGFAPEVLAELKLRRHRIETDCGGLGGYQAIARDAANAVWVGASEARKDGQAAGY